MRNSTSLSIQAWLSFCLSPSFPHRVFRCVSSPRGRVTRNIGSISPTLFPFNILACTRCRESLWAIMISSMDYNSFLVRISRYPMRGRLYLIISPDNPFSASLRLFSSVSPLVVPNTEYHFLDFLREYLLPTSSSSLVPF